MKTANEILLGVCMERGFTPEEVKNSRDRRRRLCMVRREVIARMRAERFSLDEIATFLGMKRESVGYHLYPKLREGAKRARIAHELRLAQREYESRP